MTMLTYALEGRPPYPFFGLMKVIVAASSAMGAYLTYTHWKWLAPLGILLLMTGFVEITANMHKFQWVPWNRASLVFLSASTVVSILELNGRRPLNVPGKSIHSGTD